MENSSYPSPGAPPPLISTPPPVFASPPPPRRGRGWMITAIILLVLLGLSVFGNLTQLISHTFSFNSNFNHRTMTRDAGPRLDEVFLEDNGARNKIAVVNVEGIITSHASGQGNDMVEVIKAQLDRAADDDRVKAVILRVDSPGGEVLASDEINQEISRFQNESHKPVVCSMGSLAASGGYYISAPCRWIVANKLTITGSIGVIMHGYNYRALMDKVGVVPMTFKSGKFKDMLSPDRSTNDIPAEERVMVQSLIDETYGDFKNVVRTGRSQAHDKNKSEGKALALDWENFADGRVFSGTEALRLGFVDQVGNFDDAVKRTKEMVNINNANLIEYRAHYDLADFFSMFGQSGSARDIKLDLGVELPKLQPGCMYFLWQTPGN